MGRDEPGGGGTPGSSKSDSGHGGGSPGGGVDLIRAVALGLGRNPGHDGDQQSVPVRESASSRLSSIRKEWSWAIEATINAGRYPGATDVRDRKKGAEVSIAAIVHETVVNGSTGRSLGRRGLRSCRDRRGML